MSKAIKITALSALVLILICGICLAFIETAKSRIRVSYRDAAINAAEEAVKNDTKVISFEVPVTDALAIEGEKGEKDAGLEKLLQDMSTISSEHESLTLLGVLEIPAIGVKEPIWDSCSVNALRYGVGRFPGTAQIGEAGLCNLFGHRQIGSADTKLGSIQYLADRIGGDVIVTTTDGVRHMYKIVDTVYVSDSDLMPYLKADTYSEETLCISACGWGEDPISGIYYPGNTEFVVICEVSK